MKIAQSTCTECHGIFPRTYMQQVTVTENAGTSWGLAKNLKQGSTPRGSFRVYRRNKKVWICNKCISSKIEKENIAWGWFLLIGCVVGLIVAIL